MHRPVPQVGNRAIRVIRQLLPIGTVVDEEAITLEQKGDQKGPGTQLVQKDQDAHHDGPNHRLIDQKGEKGGVAVELDARHHEHGAQSGHGILSVEIAHDGGGSKGEAGGHQNIVGLGGSEQGDWIGDAEGDSVDQPTTIRATPLFVKRDDDC